MKKLILLFSGLAALTVMYTPAQPADPDTGSAPAAQSLQPAETGTGSSNQLEYIPGETPAAPDAPVAPVTVQPAPAPETVPAPVPQAAPVVSRVPAVPETIPAPPERPAYIEIDLDRLRRGMDRPHTPSNGGGAGVLMPGMLVFDTAPLERLAERDASLEDKTFNFSSGPMMMWGAMGYGGTRNGVRFGGGGWACVSGFNSLPYTTTTVDSVTGEPIDSLVELTVIPAFGGFMMEKHWQIKNLNLFVGGMMGGGALVVVKELKRYDRNSAFWGDNHDTNDVDTSWSGPDNIDVAVAPMAVYGLHGGFTYTLASWFHLGADAGAYLFHSHRGFGYGFGSISTVNPAVRFRIVFGNLG